MIQLFIMRHGEAGPMQANDALRTLTSHGKYEVQIASRAILSDYPIDALLVSPYHRAQETAQIVVANNRAPKFKESVREFTPDADPCVAAQYLTALLETYPEYQNWLIVSHMPMVSYLVDQLCPGEMPIFSTAAIAHLSFCPSTQRFEFKRLHLVPS